MAEKKRKEIINKDLDSYIDTLRKSGEGDQPKKKVKPSNKADEYIDIAESGVFDEELCEDVEPNNIFTQILEFFKQKKGKQSVSEEVDDLTEEYEHEYETLQHEEEYFQEEEQDIERKKIGLIRSFLMRLNLFSKDDDHSDTDESEGEYEQIVTKDNLENVREDMKEVGRLAVDFLRKMPPPHLKNIKESEDFEKFREILKKYELIK